MSEREREMCKDVQCVQCAGQNKWQPGQFGLSSLFLGMELEKVLVVAVEKTMRLKSTSFLLSFGAAVLFPGHFVHSPGEKKISIYVFSFKVWASSVLATDQTTDPQTY